MSQPSISLSASEGNAAPLSPHASPSVSGSRKLTRSSEETPKVTPPGHSIFTGAHHFQMRDFHLNSTFNIAEYFSVNKEEGDLICQLNPILEASHTRNLARSPPDSECFPGTREEPIREIIVWADDDQMIAKFNTHSGEPFTMEETPHIYWLHGFAGCGKSSISLEVAKIYAGSGRLLASYFFFRGAGDRGTMNRFAVTLASQLVAAIPATAPLIGDAVRTKPGIVTGDASLATQLDLLILSPFQAVIDRGALGETHARGPFLIVIDGLDECEDRRGVVELIDHMVAFFKKHPSIPLRIFIASRVEQHIHEHLETDGVLLGNLDSHSPYKDIERYLQASFEMAAKRNRVIQAFVREHGEWPAKSDMNELIEHVNGSFLLASTIFKFIVQPATAEYPLTPIERLPLMHQMNGLDGLYAQTLARSQNLPHFRNIISTIARLKEQLSIVRIAGLLGLRAFEVVHVLLTLQAIIHVPGTDEAGEVTLCHTSLGDFFTTESRSGSFFVPPSFHLHLSYYYFASIFDQCNGQAHCYDEEYVYRHLRSVASEACDFIDAIEHFKACQSPSVGRLSPYAFLCSMLFYSIIRSESPIYDHLLYLLTECTEQMALALEFPDSRVGFWLEKSFDYRWLDFATRTVQFTEQTYETLQQHLQRASTAIHAKFPVLLERHHRPTGIEQEHHINVDEFSAIEIFKALEWIVARSQFKWKEAKITPYPPLQLAIIHSSAWQRITLHFARVLGNNDSDETSTSSDSDC